MKFIIQYLRGLEGFVAAGGGFVVGAATNQSNSINQSSN